MNLKTFQLRSLKTRITLFTLAIFLVGIWSLAFYASRMLREDMERMLGEQQFSAVSIIAADINTEMDNRLKALEKVTTKITPAILGNTASMQKFLEDRPAFENMFSGGLFVTRLDGTAIASVPVTVGRIGVNYIERDYIVGALKGQLTIGKPSLGKKLGVPSVIIASPIRGSEGEVIGVLIGAINLGIPNFLDKITDNRYGKTGGYLLVAPRYRLIITATDKNRIMEVIPAPGINPMIDRFVKGYEGSAVFVSPLGDEVLASAKSTPVAGWFVVARIPTKEAYAPIRNMHDRMLMASIFFTLLVGGLSWWMLKRQLAPMISAVKTLAVLSVTDHHPQPLPITRQDEIGQLIGGFNDLLETLGHREGALLALKDKLQEQNEDLQVNEEELRSQNDELLATEERLRMQIEEYEASQKLLKESQEAFKESQTYLIASIEGQKDTIIFLIGRDYRYLYFNKAHLDVMKYAYNQDIAVGMNILECITSDDDRKVAKENYDRALSGESHSNVRIYGDVEHAYYESFFNPILNDDNEIVGATGLARNITDRKRADAERQQLEHQFQQAQKLESLGILAGGIAHDFNNILTVIMGHCYMAQNDMIPEHEYKAAFQKMETAGNRAKDLCRQMLTYAGKSQMEQTQVNLWLLVDEVVKMLQAAIKKNVTIELDLKRDVPEINGDTSQIQQIIMNLIINSADAIGDKNGTIKVVLTKTVFEGDQTADTFGTIIKAGRYACLEVTDTGCGMDETTQKRIFEPFFTTKLTGRGLGMSAIHGIIKSHEAILQLTSKPGVGTTFKVFFPVPQASDFSKTTSATTVPLEEASGTILMVEDEELLRIMGKELLEAHGFTSLTATNGREALEIFRKRGSEIDLILMDLVMPIMDGIEAYHEIRKFSPTVPIIICSGYGVESVEQTIKNDPHAGFIHKPYKPEELRDMLVRMIKG